MAAILEFDLAYMINVELRNVLLMKEAISTSKFNPNLQINAQMQTTCMK